MNVILTILKVQPLISNYLYSILITNFQKCETLQDNFIVDWNQNIYLNNQNKVHFLSRLLLHPTTVCLGD